MNVKACLMHCWSVDASLCLSNFRKTKRLNICMYVGPLQQHDAFLILFNIFHLFCFNTRTYKVGVKGKSILNLLKFGKILGWEIQIRPMITWFGCGIF